MSTRHTTRGSRAFWIALLILLPLPLGALSGFFAYYHYILGVGSAAAGYWSLGGLAVALVWAMRLIDLAKKDISFEPSDWAWEARKYTADEARRIAEENARFALFMDHEHPWLWRRHF
jgi:hypothetical protein